MHLKRKKNSTIYKAIELVREGSADAVVSAGHSGFNVISNIKNRKN